MDSFSLQLRISKSCGFQTLGLRNPAIPPPAPPVSFPVANGPVRPGARGGILSAWDPVLQKERWFAPAGGQSGGGVITTASNLVFQVTPQGLLIDYAADNGEKLLDIPTGQTAGMGPPITYLLHGKQYIALWEGWAIHHHAVPLRRHSHRRQRRQQLRPRSPSRVCLCSRLMRHCSRRVAGVALHGRAPLRPLLTRGGDGCGPTPRGRRLHPTRSAPRRRYGAARFCLRLA